MKFKRASGILLHITSLPGRYGIGDLGTPAYDFLEFLFETHQAYWQILPLGPTGYGESPYQCFSAFAGNHLLISLDCLVEQGLLDPADLGDAPHFPIVIVDFGWVTYFKTPLLKRAYAHFRGMSGEMRAEFDGFCQANTNWLDDYALFMALKETHEYRSWINWEPELVTRQPAALEAARNQLADLVGYHRFLQWQFFKQWGALKMSAEERGIRFVGDIPIFVAHDSADVWANQDLFYLEDDGSLTVQAGVPPDYFSPTGQLWGNPLYRWDVMAECGFSWWIARVKAALSLVDIIRLDHFRGFYNYWEVPGDAETAEDGQWCDGPREPFFRALQQGLGTDDLPLIAEDLGDNIGPKIQRLREAFDLPGMRILQFAFSADQRASDFHPHRYIPHTVVYTGTHDNETVIGHYQSIDKTTRQAMLSYAGTDGSQINWDMIRLAWMSVADTAIVPMQDVLGLDNHARMNTPGTLGGNWRWRMAPDAITDESRERLSLMTTIYERAVEPPSDEENP